MGDMYDGFHNRLIDLQKLGNTGGTGDSFLDFLTLGVQNMCYGGFLQGDGFQYGIAAAARRNMGRTWAGAGFVFCAKLWIY